MSWRLALADQTSPRISRDRKTLSTLQARNEREKRWAEYFTVFLTAMGLPWEGYELVERFSPYKVGLLAINLVVLLYLLWILKKRRQEEEEEGLG